jgi:plasmid replication initiation protein
MSYQDIEIGKKSTGSQEGLVIDTLASARAAAKLKREKKAASIVARQKGKEKAEEERMKAMLEHEALAEQERVILQEKIANARKAMGVRKNDPNPPELYRLIEEWKFESLRRLWNR